MPIYTNIVLIILALAIVANLIAIPFIIINGVRGARR